MKRNPNECVNLTAYWLAVATLPASQHAAGYASVGPLEFFCD